MARRKEVTSDTDCSENFETQKSIRQSNGKASHCAREIKFRVMRTKALLLAPIRLWELKNGIDE